MNVVASPMFSVNRADRREAFALVAIATVEFSRGFQATEIRIGTSSR